MMKNKYPLSIYITSVILIICSCDKKDDNFEKLIAEFEVNTTSVSLKNEIEFLDLSIGSPVAWEWHFGDNSTSTIQNPTHSYDSIGHYQITLIVSNSNETDTIIKSNYISVFNYGVLQDIVGNSYRTIRIADKIWMAENLRTTKLNNGSPIPVVEDDVEWNNSKSQNMCWYNNDKQNSDISNYGALYNGYVIETEKICPSGWHVPTYIEWEQLIDSISTDGFNETEALALKSTYEWGSASDMFDSEPGLDIYGFSALPAGGRSMDYSFYGADGYTAWWTSTELNAHIGSDEIFTRSISISSKHSGSFTKNKSEGSSIRCVKDY